MSDDEEGARHAAELFEHFTRDCPEFASRAGFDPSDTNMMLALGRWSAELQARVDRLVPGLREIEEIHGADRAAVLQAALEELEQPQMEQAEQVKPRWILGRREE